MFAFINHFARVLSFIARPRLPRFAFAVAGIAFFAASASANPNVTFSVRDFLSRDFTNKSIVITPIGGPFIDGTNVVSGQSYNTNTGSGSFTISNMVSGTYRVNLYGNPATAWVMTVPNDDNSYSAAALVVVNPPGFTTIQNALLSAQYVRHTNGNLVGPTNFFSSNLIAGSGVTITYNASGKPTIAASGGGDASGTSAVFVASNYVALLSAPSSNNHAARLQDVAAVSNSIPLLIGSTLYVSTNGSDSTGQRTNLHKPFASLSAAIGAANDGDTIIVGPGSFAGATVGGKTNLSIVGVSPRQTRITSQIVFGTNTTVANMSFLQASWNSAINPVIRNCEISGSLSDGILVATPATTTSTGLVYNSYISSEWDGIAVQKTNWIIRAFNCFVEILGNASGTGTSVGLLAEAGGTIEFYGGAVRIASGAGVQYGAYTDGGTNRIFGAAIRSDGSDLVNGAGAIEVSATDFRTNLTSGTITYLDSDQLAASLSGATLSSIALAGTATNLPGSRFIGRGSNSIETITTLTASNITVVGGTLDLNADRVIGAYTNAGTNIGGVFTNVANLQVTNLNVASGGTLSGVVIGSGLSTLTNFTGIGVSNLTLLGGRINQASFVDLQVGGTTRLSVQSAVVNANANMNPQSQLAFDLGAGATQWRNVFASNYLGSGLATFTNGATIGRTNTYTAAEIPVGGGGIWVSNTAAGRPDAIFISVNGNGSVTNWLINVTKP